MKCARRIAIGQVFCQDCLTGMEKHPVKPDTPVVLPPRAYTPHAKRPVVHRKTRRPEEQLATLRSWVVALSILVVALLLAFAMSVTLLLRVMDGQENPSSAGQNYSTGLIPNDLEP